MSTKPLPVLRDFASHPFERVIPAQGNGMYNFKAPLMGEGSFSFLHPREGLNVFYLKCIPEENFIMESKAFDSDIICFNYILQANKNFVSRVMDHEAFELMSAKVLIIDNTNTTVKSIEFQAQEQLEFVQISFKKSLFESYFERFLGAYSKDIQDSCWKSCYTTEHYGTLIPFDVRHENCIKELLFSSFDGPLNQVYSELKISELLIYYFQYIISGELYVHDENLNLLPQADKEKVFAIKEQLDLLMEECDYEKLANDAGLAGAKAKSLFRTIFGLSIAKYHKKQRLNQAYLKILNNENQESIKEIAFSVGFNSTQAFSRSFYNEFQVRPSEVNLKSFISSRAALAGALDSPEIRH